MFVSLVDCHGRHDNDGSEHPSAEVVVFACCERSTGNLMCMLDKLTYMVATVRTSHLRLDTHTHTTHTCNLTLDWPIFQGQSPMFRCANVSPL